MVRVFPMAVTASACVFPWKGSSVAEFSDPVFRFDHTFRGFRSAKVPFLTLSGVHRRQRKRCSGVEDSSRNSTPDEQEEDPGVKVALSLLNFYKREISPLLPPSCRYVPTCSEYSMEAYKKYGVVKGTILTAWRLCRCNPLGGSGFDPPRWFGENSSPLE